MGDLAVEFGTAAVEVTVEQGMERWRVVHVDEVCEFVAHHILHQRFGQEHQVA